jgi:hypothetical protein
MSTHLRRAQDEIPDREIPDPADLIIENPSPEARAAIRALIDSGDFDPPLCGCGARHFSCNPFDF